MRLINADDVEKYLWDYIDPYEIPGALQAISKMPTIEVPDRNVGKWVEDGKGFYKCTSCGEAWSQWWSVVVPPERVYKELRYCPHCGAEMRGDAE